MDLQIEKEKLKEYAKKVKGVLWLLGTTCAAFLLYAIMVVEAAGFSPSDEQTSDYVLLEIAVWGGIIIPLLLPMAILYWRKIRLGTTATKVFTALCTISLIMWLCAELAFFLGLISGRLKSEYLLSFIITACILLYFGIFVRISILFSLLVISEKNKRATQIVLLILSFLELVLLTLYLSIGFHDINPRLITEVSPDGKNTAILSRQDNNNCYTVKIDEQIFYTKASIYHNTKLDWQGNDCFILKSSDVGDIEFRKENGVWKASPESLIRKNED